MLGGMHSIMISLSTAHLTGSKVRCEAGPSNKRITGFFNSEAKDTKLVRSQFSNIVSFIQPLCVALNLSSSSPFSRHYPYRCWLL